MHILHCYTFSQVSKNVIIQSVVLLIVKSSKLENGHCRFGLTFFKPNDIYIYVVPQR